MTASVVDVTQHAFVESLVRLAAKHGAEFDGWGTCLQDVMTKESHA